MISTLMVKMSTVKRAALAAACALGIAGAALFAHHAAAQTARPAGSHVKPGQSTVMIGPAAAITSTVHYQAELGLTCAQWRCSGDFPEPGRNHQLNITRIACYVEANAGSTLRFGAIDLVASDGSGLLGQTVPIDATAPDFDGGVIFTLNRAVDMQIAARQHMRPHFDLANSVGGTIFHSFCTATGTLSTLG
jgi:uncharacterized membrane protein